MAHSTFDNFGDLYRAAFAEQDPEKKLFLLSEVRKAIEKWEQQASRSPLAEKPKPPTVVAAFRSPSTYNGKQIA